MPIPLFYDPLLAKLICWGQDRDEAIARLRRALDEYVIAGVRTTIPFAQWLMRHPRFLAGDFSTDFIAEEWRPEEFAIEPGALDGTVREGVALDDEQVAALAAALIARESGHRWPLAAWPRALASPRKAGSGGWQDGARRPLALAGSVRRSSNAR